ncbi:hypothetical protein CA13_10970 [Planctomycetes bacterium CA13]|uniref:Uncharacterized protein n=1 Tax=Novipirellula herctigrandis TaxID=2527986 RepID=A0A5C5YYM1_9BACT|nr:hypothetical protein CA13_10970 [Planctomycetes bacterium CA13]
MMNEPPSRKYPGMVPLLMVVIMTACSAVYLVSAAIHGFDVFQVGAFGAPRPFSLLEYAAWSSSCLVGSIIAVLSARLWCSGRLAPAILTTLAATATVHGVAYLTRL